MNQQQLIALGIQLGLQIAGIIVQSAGKNGTIEDAIAALEAAKTKTAQDYLAADKAGSPTVTV